MYKTGYRLGRHWIIRDATPEQLLRISQFEKGEDWVATQTDPARAFTRVVDPAKTDFMGTGDLPPPTFVAGFIDGAKSIRGNHDSKQG